MISPSSLLFVLLLLLPSLALACRSRPTSPSIFHPHSILFVFFNLQIDGTSSRKAIGHNIPLLFLVSVSPPDYPSKLLRLERASQTPDDAEELPVLSERRTQYPEAVGQQRSPRPLFMNNSRLDQLPARIALANYVSAIRAPSPILPKLTPTASTQTRQRWRIR